MVAADYICISSKTDQNFEFRRCVDLARSGAVRYSARIYDQIASIFDITVACE